MTSLVVYLRRKKREYWLYSSQAPLQECIFLIKMNCSQYGFPCSKAKGTKLCNAFKRLFILRNDRFPVSTEVVSKWNKVTFDWLCSYDFIYSNGTLMWGLSSSLPPEHPLPGGSIVIWIRVYHGYWYYLMSLVIF